MAATKWGIVSAGKVSNDFSVAIKSLPEEEHSIVGIAARSLERAQEFAKKYDIPYAYGSYEELAQNPDVEVVHIGVVECEHYRVSLMMLNAGKHVVCEEPMCLKSAQTAHLFEVAKNKQLFLVEGLHGRHFPIYKRLEEEIAADSIGEIKLIDARIGFRLVEWDIKTLEKGVGGGILYGLGISPVHLAVWLLGRKPDKIVASGTLTENGMDECVCLTLHYSGGRIAHILCHADANLDNTATIYGTKGSITVPYFFAPSTMSTPRGNIEIPWPIVDRPVNYPGSEGFVYQAQGVRDSLMKGELEHPLIPAANSIASCEIIDEALRQCGRY